MDTRSLVTKYIHHRNYINKGVGEVTTIRYIVQVILLGKIAFREMSMTLMLIAGLLSVACFWTIGWAWDKWKAYDYEHEWSNKRNPTLQTIKRKV